MNDFHFESLILESSNSKDSEKITDSKESKKTLAMFNFFGTLAWGIDGRLFNYENITPSSPHILDKFKQLHKCGYTLCILEYVGKSKLEEFKKLVKAYYEIFKNPPFSIHVFIITNKKNYDYLYDDLVKYFKPENDCFGKKSFYCGDEVSLNSGNPFLRHSNKDSQIANKLNFLFYEPDSVISNNENNRLIFKDFRLIITYGHENSGIEMDYEKEIEDNKFDDKIPCKIKICDSMKQCLIKSSELFKADIKDKIEIPQDMTFIIYGSHPTSEERDRIRDYFIYDSEIIYWYSRPPYKKSETYELFLQTHDHPSDSLEKFVRIY